MNGFYNINKPEGISSSDLVIKLRGLLRAKTGVKQKVGHMGTLDPLASGVLTIAVGSATRLFDYLLSKKKRYIAGICFGRSTDTLDRDGITIAESDCIVTDNAVKDVCKSFAGDMPQIPPQYSAKSVGGVRAYKLARAGIEVELCPKTVTIYSVNVVEKISENNYLLDIVCGGGTYIRSICRDIGVMMNVPSYMSSLIRVQNGSMDIKDSVNIEDIEANMNAGYIDLRDFAATLATASYSEVLRFKIDNGVKIPLCDQITDNIFSVTVGDSLYGIGTAEGGCLSMILRF